MKEKLISFVMLFFLINLLVMFIFSIPICLFEHSTDWPPFLFYTKWIFLPSLISALFVMWLDPMDSSRSKMEKTSVGTERADQVVAPIEVPAAKVLPTLRFGATPIKPLQLALAVNGTPQLELPVFNSVGSLAGNTEPLRDERVAAAVRLFGGKIVEVKKVLQSGNVLRRPVSGGGGVPVKSDKYGNEGIIICPAPASRPQQPLRPKNPARPRMESLTRDQKNLLNVWVRRWDEYHSSLALVDREKADEAIHAAYRDNGLETPKAIIWCGSPAVALIGITLTRVLEKRKGVASDSLLKHIYDLLAPCAPKDAWARVWNDSLYGVERALQNGMGLNVKREVMDGVESRISTMLGEHFSNDFLGYINNRFERGCGPRPERAFKMNYSAVFPLGLGLRSLVEGHLLKAHWALNLPELQAHPRDVFYVMDAMEDYWYRAENFLAEVMGMERLLRPLRGLIQLSRHCGHFWPFEKVCWVTERPNFVHRDIHGFVHAENGLAVRYPDGWGVRALHGVAVDEKGIRNHL